jgi:hypothetical protein
MVLRTLRKIYERGEEINRSVSESDRLYRVHSALNRLMPLVLVVLLVVLALEFFVNLPHSQHVTLLQIEKLILAYFIVEILVDFTLYESNKKFLKHKWFDILLVIPFFSLMKGLRGLRVLKLGKPFKPAKAAKAGRAAKMAKHGKKAQHTTKFFKKTWEKLGEKLKGE